MPGKIAKSSIESIIFQNLGKEHGVKFERMSSSSTIASDLGVDGDDAKEFLEFLEQRFNIELKDILYSRFWPEAGLVFDKQIVPISIGELADTIVSRIKTSDGQ